MFLEKIKLSQAPTQVLRRDSNAFGNLRLIRFRVLSLIVNKADKGINFGHFCAKAVPFFKCWSFRRKGTAYPFPTTVAL